ncbi:MAG: metalloregulator ArsR/SmtB family transcription factor [Deinococcota bacterium]
MNTFAALADPTRLRIFELIAEGEKTVGEIVDKFSFSPPTISQHLKILRQANLVTVRADAQKRIYAMDYTGLQEMEYWLSQQRQHWQQQLDALESYLDETSTAEGGGA